MAQGLSLDQVWPGVAGLAEQWQGVAEEFGNLDLCTAGCVFSWVAVHASSVVSSPDAQP